ncbi:DnaD domain protein [uncultured Subdoligranulum sp.]|uniref:DnaD domain protein n=1 Tax=uncultured Subdoligranulum sp. TaxID=512298 RepID=UPI0025F5C297|nr:DnaD domain protein [uncultured Subdoligranulum sp.]
MPYKLAPYNGDTLAVPQIVLTHLPQADGDTVRTALYVLQTGDTDPRTIARALGLTSVEAARRALQYWAGAGLLENTKAAPPAVPAEVNAAKIDLANLNDPYVSVLCEEAQTAFGKALSRSEMQRLVSLYLNEGWQPDVILLCCAEVARQGRRSVAAVARELARWREDGVESGEDAERYLRKVKQREDWCADAAAQFGIEPTALTRWERGAVARWHEEWGIGREMIDEALLRAGSKNTIRYVDGILRAWRAQGITTVAAARGQGQLAGSNILATERPAAPQPAAASAQKDLFNRDWAALFDEEG